MGRYVYVVDFIGYGAGVQYESTVEVECVHSLNTMEDAGNAMFLIHEEIKKHFIRFKILSIEVIS